ncbi:unnamed protein product, partial [Timema podura]|nr:unnamed protein product [Timema podura]
MATDKDIPDPQPYGSFALSLSHVDSINTEVNLANLLLADRVDMFWNKIGSAVLLMTSMEVDKSGSSYYGKQALHALTCKGETAIVLLS